MATGVNVEDIVLFLIEHAADDLGITQLTKLVYLADVEHQQLYGTPLSAARWQYHTYGPFTPSIYTAAESLEEKEHIVCTVRSSYKAGGKGYAAAERRHPTPDRLSPRGVRVLSTVLERFGHLSLPQIKREAYATATMREATQGEILDLSHEPRRLLGKRVPALAAFLRRAPDPIVRDIGDAAASAREDLEILDEFGGLRREANRELV